MKRSRILRILARRLSNRDVEDIQQAALDEMEYVQDTVLQRLPNQPWFLERDEVFPWPKEDLFIQLPEDYNGLMTHGGVFFREAELDDSTPPQVVELKNEWEELKRISSRQAVPQEEASGLPWLRNFRILGTKLYPLPEQSEKDHALRVLYYAKDESPSGENDLENAWMREFADLFISEVGMRLASDLEDSSALQFFQAMREEARKNYDEKVEEERHAAEVLSF